MSSVSMEILRLVSISTLISSCNELIKSLQVLYQAIFSFDLQFKDLDSLNIGSMQVVTNVQSIFKDVLVLYLLSGFSLIKIKYFCVLFLLMLTKGTVELFAALLFNGNYGFMSLHFGLIFFLMYCLHLSATIVSSLNGAMKEKLEEDQIILTMNEINDFKMGIPQLGGLGDVDPGNLPYDKKIEISYQRISILDYKPYLQDGFFGRSYKAQYFDKNKKTVVTLQKNQPNITSVDFRYFLRQLKIMMTIGHHENIVELLGACSKDIAHGKLYIVMDYYENGNLSHFLEENRQSFCLNHSEKCSSTPHACLNLLQLIRWSYEIACAMKFLHDKNIIHGALCCKNILLTHNKTTKITELGATSYLCQLNSQTIDSQTDKIPWRHFSGESLETMHFDTRSDAWSYGITVWEIFSLGEIPYSNVSLPSILRRILKSEENGYDKIHPLSKPEPQCSEEIYGMMTKCWSPESPSFDYICKLMFGISMPKRRTIVYDYDS